MVSWNDEIAPHLHDAWAELLDKHGNLFPEEAGEPTVSGAFAAFLERLCHDGLVAITEYDKMNDDLKMRVEKQVMLGDDIEAIKPDIVIHRHGDDSLDGNLLAIEMKKWANGNWRHDEDKLSEMTSPPRGPRRFQYRFGLLIRFRTDGQIGSATLFRQGEAHYLNPATMRIL